MIDRSDYPRPLLYRAGWTNRNGEWDFAFDDADAGLKNGWANGFVPTHRIRVPFSYETAMSGIGDLEIYGKHEWRLKYCWQKYSKKERKIKIFKTICIR